MRAKFINEIRQEIEGSGLGAIGVGKEGVLKAWKSAKIDIPNIIYNCKPMNIVFNDPVYDDLRRIIERRGNFLFSNMLWVDIRNEAYNFTVEQMIKDWLNLWNIDKVLFKINGESWSSSRFTICRFDENAKVGTLTVRGHDLFNDIYGFFIQNK